LAFLLLSLTLIVLLVSFEKKSDSIRRFSALTTLPSISLGVEYFEPVNRFYSDNSNELFVDMRPLNMMDFVYAK
jgi:hypothetical protein